MSPRTDFNKLNLNDVVDPQEQAHTGKSCPLCGSSLLWWKGLPRCSRGCDNPNKKGHWPTGD